MALHEALITTAGQLLNVGSTDVRLVAAQLLPGVLAESELIIRVLVLLICISIFIYTKKNLVLNLF